MLVIVAKFFRHLLFGERSSQLLGQRKVYWYLTIPGFVFSLVGCAGPSVSVYSPPQQGLLITDFHSSVTGAKLSLIQRNQNGIPNAVFEITPLDNFRVIELPPGNYTWREIDLGSSSRNIRDIYNFTIEANKLNYIGDVLLKVDPDGVRISFINQSTEVRRRLQQEYAQLYQRYPYIENLTKKSEE